MKRRIVKEILEGAALGVLFISIFCGVVIINAAGALDPKKHLYSFEGYLSLLQMLKTVLYAGMPPDDALDAVQSGWDIEKILEIWRYSKL